MKFKSVALAAATALAISTAAGPGWAQGGLFVNAATDQLINAEGEVLSSINAQNQLINPATGNVVAVKVNGVWVSPTTAAALPVATIGTGGAAGLSAAAVAGGGGAAAAGGAAAVGGAAGAAGATLAGGLGALGVGVTATTVVASAFAAGLVFSVVGDDSTQGTGATGGTTGSTGSTGSTN